MIIEKHDLEVAQKLRTISSYFNSSLETACVFRLPKGYLTALESHEMQAPLTYGPMRCAWFAGGSPAAGHFSPDIARPLASFLDNSGLTC
jgi:hypothetical protein